MFFVDTFFPLTRNFWKASIAPNCYYFQAQLYPISMGLNLVQFIERELLALQ